MKKEPKKVQPKKLRLHQETLRWLDLTETDYLKGVVGMTSMAGNTCPQSNKPICLDTIGC